VECKIITQRPRDIHI